jgi:hypothetical protein
VADRARAPHPHIRRGQVRRQPLVLAIESVRCLCGRLIALTRVRGDAEFARLAGRCPGCGRGAALHVEIVASRRTA